MENGAQMRMPCFMNKPLYDLLWADRNKKFVFTANFEFMKQLNGVLSDYVREHQVSPAFYSFVKQVESQIYPPEDGPRRFQNDDEEDDYFARADNRY